MSERIFIAGENEDLCDLLASFAEKEGCEVKVICDVTRDSENIIRECNYFDPDVTFLSGGYIADADSCRSVNLMSEVYILKENGSNIGDELSVPVDVELLVSILKKYSKRVKEPFIAFNKDNMTIKSEGVTFELTMSEYNTLSCFVNNPNRVFTRSQLAVEVFGVDAPGGEKTVEDAVVTLKEKLDGLSNKWSLRLLWGVGYKFEVIG